MGNLEAMIEEIESIAPLAKAVADAIDKHNKNALHLRPRMRGAMLSQVARLGADAALHLDATPESEGLAQALVTVDDLQERLGQASPLQTYDHLVSRVRRA